MISLTINGIYVAYMWVAADGESGPPSYPGRASHLERSLSRESQLSIASDGIQFMGGDQKYRDYFCSFHLTSFIVLHTSKPRYDDISITAKSAILLIIPGSQTCYGIGNFSGLSYKEHYWEEAFLLLKIT